METCRDDMSDRWHLCQPPRCEAVIQRGGEAWAEHWRIDLLHLIVSCMLKVGDSCGRDEKEGQ
jgi:hypothetical protein